MCNSLEKTLPKFKKKFAKRPRRSFFLIADGDGSRRARTRERKSKQVWRNPEIMHNEMESERQVGVKSTRAGRGSTRVPHADRGYPTKFPDLELGWLARWRTSEAAPRRKKSSLLQKLASISNHYLLLCPNLSTSNEAILSPSRASNMRTSRRSYDCQSRRRDVR